MQKWLASEDSNHGMEIGDRIEEGDRLRSDDRLALRHERDAGSEANSCRHGCSRTERHERILLNCCEAMGVTDYSGFGDPQCPNKSPLPGIAA